MLKKSAKILGTYVLGIVISMFLQVPLSPFFGNNLILFSTVTSIVTISLVYTELWRFGKYDALRKENKIINAVGYMGMYVVISFVIELTSAILKPANLSAVEIVHTIWFFPYSGFYTDRTRIIGSLIAALVTIILCIAGYYMGVAGISFSDKILEVRKRHIDKKAEKHFKEIEEIKEQYREKKDVDEKNAVE